MLSIRELDVESSRKKILAETNAETVRKIFQSRNSLILLLLSHLILFLLLNPPPIPRWESLGVVDEAENMLLCPSVAQECVDVCWIQLVRYQTPRHLRPSRVVMTAGEKKVLSSLKLAAVAKWRVDNAALEQVGVED